MSKAKSEAPATGPAVAVAGPASECAPARAARPARAMARTLSAQAGGLPAGNGSPLARAHHTGMLQRALGNTRTNQMLGVAPALTAGRGSAAIQRKCACGGEAALLAQEPAHTVQRRAIGGTAGRMPVSNPGDPAEQEAEHIAQRVVSGARIDRPVQSASAVIQRYSWDDFVDDAAAVGDAVTGGASAAAGVVTDTASAAVDAAGGVVTSVVPWLETEAGRVALAGATALAGSFGGAATLTGTAIVITIPDVELCTPRSVPFTLPMMNVLIPFWGWGGAFGPIGIGAAAGVRLGLQPSVAFSYGPCRLQRMALRLDPLRGSYAGTAQLYIAGAVTDTMIGEAALKVIGVVGLFEPPIAIMAGVEGGLRATLRGVGAGALQETVTVAYTGGAFALDLDNTLKLGGAIELAVDFFANASLYDFVVCEYVLPLVDTTLYSEAEQWNIPIRVTSGGVTTGPLTRKPIPFTDIEVFVNRQRPETRCLSLTEIRDELCRRGYLPAFLCTTTPTPPTGPAGPPGPPLAPPAPVTPPLPPDPVDPLAADPCRLDVSFTFDHKIFKSPPTTEVRARDAKHTKMARKSSDRMTDLARTADCNTIPVECEKAFCVAAKARSTAYGGQIDNVTRGQSRYQTLLTNAFDDAVTPPPRSGKWNIPRVKADAIVGFEIEKTAKTNVYTVHGNMSNGGKNLDAHLFPGPS